jgi:hypothetical protein
MAKSSFMSSQWSCFLGGLMTPSNHRVNIVADNARTHSSHFDFPSRYHPKKSMPSSAASTQATAPVGSLNGETRLFNRAPIATTVVSRWDECPCPSSDCSPTEPIRKLIPNTIRDCTPYIPKRPSSHTRNSTMGHRAFTTSFPQDPPRRTRTVRVLITLLDNSEM